jgi:cytochrome c-type biogenesis protein CcmH/NrfF
MDSQLILWVVIAATAVLTVLVMAKKFKKDHREYEDKKQAKKEAEIISLLADEELSQEEKARLIEVLNTKK